MPFGSVLRLCAATLIRSQRTIREKGTPDSHAMALTRAWPASAASPGPRLGLAAFSAAVAIPDRAAATRRIVRISMSPEPTEPLRLMGPGKSRAPSTPASRLTRQEISASSSAADRCLDRRGARLPDVDPGHA
jgi:hypothetical protein